MPIKIYFIKGRTSEKAKRLIRDLRMLERKERLNYLKQLKSKKRSAK